MIHSVKTENEVKPKHTLGSIWKNSNGHTYMVIHNQSNHEYCLLCLNSGTCCEITTKDPSFTTIEALVSGLTYLGQQAVITVKITN